MMRILLHYEDDNMIRYCENFIISVIVFLLFTGHNNNVNTTTPDLLPLLYCTDVLPITGRRE